MKKMIVCLFFCLIFINSNSFANWDDDVDSANILRKNFLTSSIFFIEHSGRNNIYGRVYAFPSKIENTEELKQMCILFCTNKTNTKIYIVNNPFYDWEDIENYIKEYLTN